jgi:hypothetical protein
MQRFVRLIFMLTLSIYFKPLSAQQDSTRAVPKNSPATQDELLRMALTATVAKYLTETEQDIIHIINIMRLDPRAFIERVVKSYPELVDEPEMRNSSYYKSLLQDLAAASPMQPLKPNEPLFRSARCHATESGKTGYVGHDRSQTCKGLPTYGGECCQYGTDKALGVVMQLLIDEGIESLGHRKILMGDYTLIGVAMRPHIAYRVNTVLDLGNAPKTYIQPSNDKPSSLNKERYMYIKP